MGFKWQTTPEVAFTQLAVAYTDAIDTAVLAIAKRYEGEIAAWMRDNAPWQDQTGAARRQLGAEVAELTNAIVIVFGHGVDYGKFLEWANSGRYAVVAPALDYFLPKVWADIQGALS